MEIIVSVSALILMYVLLFVSKRRRMREMEKTKRLAWDKGVEKFYGKWHSY